MLSTPPAFVLSQDQTLHCLILFLNSSSQIHRRVCLLLLFPNYSLKKSLSDAAGCFQRSIRIFKCGTKCILQFLYSQVSFYFFAISTLLLFCSIKKGISIIFYTDTPFKELPWRRPTFPLPKEAVSSALVGLTALFGMGRGVSPPL